MIYTIKCLRNTIEPWTLATMGSEGNVVTNIRMEAEGGFEMSRNPVPREVFTSCTFPDGCEC